MGYCNKSIASTNEPRTAIFSLVRKGVMMRILVVAMSFFQYLVTTSSHFLVTLFPRFLNPFPSVV